jgi:hypothetical protein
MTIEADIRTPLQTALSTIAANVYNGIPETMTSQHLFDTGCTLSGKRFDQWRNNKGQSQSYCDGVLSLMQTMPQL